jgi:hypothetical protein
MIWRTETILVGRGTKSNERLKWKNGWNAWENDAISFFSNSLMIFILFKNLAAKMLLEDI